MKVLKFLFIFGWVGLIILTFVPYKKMIVGDMYGIGGRMKAVSAYDEIQILFRQNPGGAFIIVVVFALYIAFVILALVYAKRWIFLSGAIFGAFSLLLGLFMPPVAGEKYFILPKIISIIATILVLTGFFIKEEKPLPSAT